jgi:hypothetical protein
MKTINGRHQARFLGLIFAITFIICGLAMSTTFAQTVDTCPVNRVCLTVEQARQALIDASTVKAQEQQILDLKKAILDEKSVTLDVKIELAKTMGQLTATQSENVRLAALVELLSKLVRPKKIGLINF